MKKSFKKVIVALTAVTSLATCAMGFTASAYSPTITKYFGNNAKATLYSDTTYAYATTSRSGKDCTVIVNYHGATRSGYSYGYTSAINDASGSGSSANSYHAAGGYSTSIYH